MNLALAARRAAAVSILALTVGTAQAAPTPIWTTSLPSSVNWHRITGAGTFLVGMDGGLASIEPATGKVLWQRDDIKKTQAYSVREVPGTPYLVVNEYISGLVPQTSVTTINMATGQTAWKFGPYNGMSLGLYPYVARNMVVLFGIGGYDNPSASGVYAAAFAIDSGKELWRTKYRGGLTTGFPLHFPSNAGLFASKQDLSGHQDPVFVGDTMYVPFDGLAAIDVNTGAIRWDVEFNAADKDLKQAYPSPVVDGDTVYAAGRGGIIQAIDSSTGAVKWKSEKVRSGIIAQLTVTGDTVYARIGGNFWSQGEKKFKLDTPLGLIAVDKATGARRWENLKAKEGITNLLLLPDQAMVLAADAYNLYGFDIKSAGKATPALTVPLDFKRDMTGTEMGAAGLKMATGFLTGGLAGMTRGAGSVVDDSSRLDVPVALSQRDGGKVLVRGTQHMLMFDPVARKADWSTYYPAPASSGLLVAAMAALTVASSMQGVANVAYNGSSGISEMNNLSKTWGDLDKVAAKRFSASRQAQKYTYVLTEVEEAGSKGVGLMGIDMDTGKPGKQLLTKEKEPDYEVDDIDGILYFIKDRKQLSAFSLN